MKELDKIEMLRALMERKEHDTICYDSGSPLNLFKRILATLQITNEENLPLLNTASD